MKQLILIGLLLGSIMSGLRAEGPPPPRPPEAKEAPKEEPKISTGERIEIPDVGFSIVPPNGWMVHKNSHGSSLLFETPKQPNQTYQPTIQVMVFSKHRYIDEVTMKEYGDLIVEKFGKMSNRVTGYRLRDAAIQRLETGDPSILYYTEFQYDDVPIMQMHILISSATNHFVMTYTDVAKVFEDESSPGLAIAYTSMHSAQLSTRPPWRWRGFAIGGGAALLVILGWFTLHFVRARRLAKLGQRIEEEDSKEITRDEESQYYSRHSPATHAESHAGDDEWASSKPKSKSAAKISQVQSSHFDEDDEPEVSDVVPISTLEKSLHPGRKRRQEAAAAAPRQQAPMPPPISQQEAVSQYPISNHQPVSNHQPMMQQGHAQQGMPQQGMHPSHAQVPQGMPTNQQGMPQQGMQNAQQGMQGQGMPQQGMQNAQHGMPQQGMPMAQQPMHAAHQGMPQAGMNQQGFPQQAMQNAQQGAMHPNLQNTHPGMPQHEMPMTQQPMHAAQQGMPQPGMQNAQQAAVHPNLQHAHPGMSQHGVPMAQQPMDAAQQGMQNAQQGIPQQPMHAAHQGMPQAGMNQQAMPQQGMQNAQQGIPQHGMPMNQQAFPQQGMQNEQQGIPQQPMHAAHQGMNQQAFPQQGMQNAQQGMPQQPMHAAHQGMPQAGMNQQAFPQQGMQNAHPGMSQNGMPVAHQPVHAAQQGMPQAGMNQQGIPQQGMPMTAQSTPHHGTQNAQQRTQNAQQGMPQPMQSAQQSMAGMQNAPQHAMSNAQQTGAPYPDYEQPMSHPQVAMPHKGMPQPVQAMNHPQAGYPHASQDQQPVSQHPFMPQPAPAMAAHLAPPVPMPETGSQVIPITQNQAANAAYISHAQPQSQVPITEQPAYVHQSHASATQAYAAAPAPAPVAQTFAPPAQAAAPVTPQFAPSADPVSEPPITASRTTQSQMNRKQPLSQNLDDDPDMSEEARLSEILPKAGTIEKSKPKRKGLFWRKKTDDDDDQDEVSEDKAGWNVPAPKKSKGKDVDDDGDADADAGDEWAVSPSKETDVALAEKDDDEPAESEAWAPEATKRSDPKRDSLLNETQGPQHLARRAPQGPVTKEHNAAVAEADSEDGWNLNQEVASDHDEEDEEEVG